jgi:hypothetical protein
VDAEKSNFVYSSEKCIWICEVGCGWGAGWDQGLGAGLCAGWGAIRESVLDAYAGRGLVQKTVANSYNT